MIVKRGDIFLKEFEPDLNINLKNPWKYYFTYGFAIVEPKAIVSLAVTEVPEPIAIRYIFTQRYNLYYWFNEWYGYEFGPFLYDLWRIKTFIFGHMAWIEIKKEYIYDK